MNYFLGIDGTGGTLVADFEEGAAGTTPGLNHPISGTTVIQNGVWYHAAATYDGTTWRLYLNGILEGSPLVAGQPVRSDSTQDAGLGTAMTSTGVASGFFDGTLDEVRIWDHARTEPQIHAAMSGPLTVAPGLVARWGANEGTGTTISSSAGATIDGTLTNGPLWVTGTPFVSTANLAPNVPTNVAPSDGSTGVSTSPMLQVQVSDPNGGQLTTSFYGRPVGNAAAEDFTFLVLPDTQHYVDLDEARADTYRQQTQWIVDNADALNVVFVSHLGDITESFDTVEAEWQRADSAMDTLDNAGIPNNLAPGNHDLGTGGTTSSFYDQYFPPSRYDLPANPWYGGWLGEEAGQVQRLNKDNYELFTAGGIDFLIVHLEIDMPTYAVQWANEIIDRYPDRQVIISTHAFLNTSNARPTSRVTTRADGLSADQVWTQLIAPNCNVFLVVNGHYPGEGRTTSNNSCGQPVHQVLTDYQSRVNGGDGWLRYYKFRPASNTIEAYTYSPKLGAFETDASSQFTLPYAMDSIGGFQLIGSVSTASGGTPSMAWPTLLAGTQYEWYAVTSDGLASQTSPTWSFTTATANREPVFAQDLGDRSDPEGAVVSVDAGASDADGDVLVFAASGLPAGLSINAATGIISGTIGFGAAAGSPYSVSVTVRDGAVVDATDTFTWSVSDVNREPVFAQDLGDRSDPEGALVSVDAGASDADGDVLVFAASGLPAGLSINAATGIISGTIGFGAAAGSPYAVSVTVRDGAVVDATDTFTWSVSDVNREPVFAQDLGDRSDPEGAVVSVDAGASDADGDVLVFAASGLPAGLSINAATGIISGTIGFGAAAGSPYAVSVTVRDGAVVDATDTFTWTVGNTNREPVFAQDLGDRSDPEGAVVSVDAGASDADGDVLVFAARGCRLVCRSTRRPGSFLGRSGLVLRRGVRMRCRSRSVMVRWWMLRTPSPGPWPTPIGSRCLLRIWVIAAIPRVLLVSVDAGASDADGDVLVFAASGLPAGLSINPATGIISGTIGFGAAAGSPYSVSVTVRDGAVVDATDTFTWSVSDVNREPVFAQDLGDRSDPEGAVVSVDAGASDADGDVLVFAASGVAGWFVDQRGDRDHFWDDRVWCCGGESVFGVGHGP